MSRFAKHVQDVDHQFFCDDCGGNITSEPHAHVRFSHIYHPTNWWTEECVFHLCAACCVAVFAGSALSRGALAAAPDHQTLKIGLAPVGNGAHER